MKLRLRRTQNEGEAVWQVSYIDLLTAMLAAFTLLLSISKPDQLRFDSFATAAAGTQKTQKNLADLADQLKRTIDSSATLRNDVKVVKTDQGVELRFGAKLLFPIGESGLQREGEEALGLVGALLSDFITARDAYIAVEGHTDDVPFAGRAGMTNWELSTARASNVVHFLLDTTGIPVARLSAAGFADTRPVNAGRDTSGAFSEKARVDNRRVVLRIYYYRPPTVLQDADFRKQADDSSHSINS